MFYLAVELQSLSFYVLATFSRNSEYNAEAGIKYFILGALSSGFLLFGFSLIYISLGAVVFEDILKLNIFGDFMTSWSLIFIAVALLFKIGAFPFHQWLCDVYEGVLVTVTAIFSVVPKAILFALFIRLSFMLFNSFTDKIELLILFSGLSSIGLASIAALYQKRLKRLLAYSAISHSGFILLAISCNSIESIKASVIYIIIYLIMTTALFGVIFLVLRTNNLPKFLIN
jgi:NADH-quinone oxidoreductase subunit N